MATDTGRDQTRARQRIWRLGLTLAVSLLLIGVSAAPAGAATTPASSSTCVTCLGPQTNALWDRYLPLGGFSRYGKQLTRNLRQEALFIDNVETDSGGQALLWPLVKALGAFGAWTGAEPAKPTCYANNECSIPTFDLSHAVYHSRYAAFVSADLVNSQGHCVHQLPAEAAQVLKHRHWRFWRTHFESEPCWNSPASTPGNDRTPLLLVGGYLQMGPQVVFPADLEGPAPGGSSGPPGSSQAPTTGLPFATVHDALANNTPTKQFTPSALYDINAEANLIEALVCHADGMQPRKTCGRIVIRKLLKEVR
jgi:hypothetical protein